jgi:gas vesicle protein
MRPGDYLKSFDILGESLGTFGQVPPFKESLMRDLDDTPYIVIERDGGGGLGSFVLGALVGAGLALLFAPQSGEDTQEEIKSRALKLKDVAKDRVRDAQTNIEGRLHTAREHVQTRVESVKEAVDSGRKAAVEARSDLEEKLERSKAAYRAGIEAAKEVATPAVEGGPVETAEVLDNPEEVSG